MLSAGQPKNVRKLKQASTYRTYNWLWKTVCDGVCILRVYSSHFPACCDRAVFLFRSDSFFFLLRRRRSRIALQLRVELYA